MLSIIVTSWGKENTIESCLTSIKKQLANGDELIVIHSGISAAHSRNQGAKKAKGKLLVFIDGDMILDSNFISSLKRDYVEIQF